MDDEREDKGLDALADSPAVGCTFLLSLLLIVILVVVGAIQVFNGSGWASLIGFGVAILLVWFSSRTLRRWLERRYARKVKERQRSRTERARRAYFAVLTNQELVRPFVLYLRPFNAQSEYRLSLGSMGTSLGGSSAMPDSGGLEVGLSKLTAPFGDFVALGEDIETIGAGRVVAGDADWRIAVKKLAEAATCIIIFPSPTAGVTWEMELLRNSGLIAKTVFLMPPLVTGELSGSAARMIDRFSDDDVDDSVSRSGPEGTVRLGNEHARLDWDRACAHYRSYGIELPEFEDYGQAFLLDENNNALKICPLFAPLEGWRHRVDPKYQAQLRSRIQHIGNVTGSDWFPIANSVSAPANQHLLPLLSYIATLVEREWPETVHGSS